MEKRIPVEIMIFDQKVLQRCVDCETIWKELDTMHPTHQQQAVAYLPKEVADEYINVAHWLADILDRYSDHISLRVIDAISLEGVAKATQYRVNSFPAIIINHSEVFNSENLNQASAEIECLVYEPACA